MGAARDMVIPQLDCLSRELSSGYKEQGIAAFVIRTLDNGGIRLLGASFDRARVAGMLRAAADALEAGPPSPVGKRH